MTREQYEALAIELGFVKTYRGRWRTDVPNANESDHRYFLDAQEAVSYARMVEHLKNLSGKK